MNQRIKIMLQLARIQTAGLTLLTAVFGLLLNSNGAPPFRQLMVCLFIGLCAHLHGFIFNEIMDIEVDKASPDVREKPLASGRVSRKEAWIAAWLPALAAYLVIIVFIPNIPLWIVFLIGHVGEKIYNIWGKRFPGLDVLLGLWAFTFCLFGAGSVSIAPLWRVEDLWAMPLPVQPMVWVIAALGGLQILFNNSVEGGMKDIHTDKASGAKTISLMLGLTVEGDKVVFSSEFSNYTWALKTITFIVAMLGILYIPNTYHSTIFTLLLPIFLVVGFTLWRFTSNPVFDRTKLKRIFSIHEIFTYMIVPILMYPFIGVFLTIFLVLFPIIWYLVSNRGLYGTWLNPAV